METITPLYLIITTDTLKKIKDIYNKLESYKPSRKLPEDTKKRMARIANGIFTRLEKFTDRHIGHYELIPSDITDFEYFYTSWLGELNFLKNNSQEDKLASYMEEFVMLYANPICVQIEEKYTKLMSTALNTLEQNNDKMTQHRDILNKALNAIEINANGQIVLSQQLQKFTEAFRSEATGISNTVTYKFQPKEHLDLVGMTYYIDIAEKEMAFINILEKTDPKILPLIIYLIDPNNSWQAHIEEIKKYKLEILEKCQAISVEKILNRAVDILRKNIFNSSENSSNQRGRKRRSNSESFTGGRHRFFSGRLQNSIQDDYHTLNLPFGSSLRKVNRAYKKLAFELHPDRAKIQKLSEEKTKENIEQFKEIQSAYERIVEFLKEEARSQTRPTASSSRANE